MPKAGERNKLWFMLRVVTLGYNYNILWFLGKMKVGMEKKEKKRTTEITEQQNWLQLHFMIAGINKDRKGKLKNKNHQKN